MPATNVEVVGCSQVGCHFFISHNSCLGMSSYSIHWKCHGWLVIQKAVTLPQEKNGVSAVSFISLQ